MVDDNVERPTSSDVEIRAPNSSRATSIGRVRTCWSLTGIEWTTMMMTLSTISIGIGSGIFRLWMLEWDDPDIVYSILILINLLIAIFYLFHGIFQEQPFEMFTLSQTIFFVWILLIANYFSGYAIRRKLIVMVLSSVLTVPNIIFILFVGRSYWDSGTLIFKTVGADIKFQRFCRHLFFAYSLMAFDMQAQISCLILILQNGFAYVRTEDIVIIIFGTMYAFVWISIGYVAMRTENMRLTWLFGGSSLAQPVYAVYLFTQAVNNVAFEFKYSVLSLCVYISASSLVLAHFTLLAVTVTVSQNYGKGLKERVYGGVSASSGWRRVVSRESGWNERESLLGTTENDNYDAILPAPSQSLF